MAERLGVTVWKQHFQLWQRNRWRWRRWFRWHQCSGARDPGAAGSITGIDIAASIASFYSGETITGPQGVSPSAGGTAGPKVFTGGGNTPGQSVGGAGTGGKLVIIYEAV